MPRALDPEKRQRARRLRKRGKSLNEIAEALGISYGSAHRFTKGLCPEKERDADTRARIAATKANDHEAWKRSAPRGDCGTPGCTRAACAIPYGKCHCGCGRDAPFVVDDDRTRNYVRGEPRLYVQGCQRSGDTLMVAGNGEPLLSALERAGLSRIEVTRRAKPKLGKGVKFGKGVVADLIGLEGYRLRRARCESIVSVLRDAFEENGLDASELTLERLFTEERPTDEPPPGQRARRTKRQRDPIPPNERGSWRYVHADYERARKTAEADDSWLQAQAIEYLRLPRSIFIAMELGGRIRGEERRVGAVRVRVYRQLDVKRLGRELFTSDAAWDQRRRDREKVLLSALRRGASLAEAQALADRSDEQREAWRRIRVDTGRPSSPGPPPRYFEWFHAWQALAPERNDQRCEFGGACGRISTHRLAADDATVGYYCAEHAQRFDPKALGRLGLSRRKAALMIARDDEKSHPALWEYRPDDAPESAIALVLYGVEQAKKALEKGIRQTRAA